MSQKKEFDDIFDDDFEVTYEEDPVYEIGRASCRERV